MKKTTILLLSLLTLFGAPEVNAQFNLGKAVNSATKVAQALTINDEQMAAYVKQSIEIGRAHV